MAQQMLFSHTSWAGIQLDHPADWELFRLVRKADRWRFGLTDRHHQRVDMRWRKLGYKPNLDKMLERHQEKEKKAKTTPATGLAEGWRGTVRQVEGGCVVNAGKFIEQGGILVEMIIVWPGKRDQNLENTILRSVRHVDVENGRKLWQAMGLKAHVGQEYDIIEYKAEVGRVELVFGKSKKGPRVAIERIAMPKYWLKGSLTGWLKAREEKWTVLETGKQNVRGHDAAILKAAAKGLMVDSILLKKKVKAEIAWLCDKEQRVYRVSCLATQRGKDISVPDDVEVVCCGR
jgi:hypothetical protein